jgi:hypothetical protein
MSATTIRGRACRAHGGMPLGATAELAQPCSPRSVEIVGIDQA